MKLSWKVNRVNYIYKIECKANGRVYVGSSSKPVVRRNAHLTKLRSNNHSIKELQEDFNIYGEDMFEMTVIDSTQDDVLELESQWVSSYDSLINGYNRIDPITHYNPLYYLYDKNSGSMEILLKSMEDVSELIKNKYGGRAIINSKCDSYILTQSIKMMTKLLSTMKSDFHYVAHYDMKGQFIRICSNKIKLGRNTIRKKVVDGWPESVSPSMVGKNKQKAVMCIDIKNGEIHNFDSVLDAGNFIGSGKAKSNIGQRCNGYSSKNGTKKFTRLYRGFAWKFLEDNIDLNEYIKNTDISTYKNKLEEAQKYNPLLV